MQGKITRSALWRFLALLAIYGTLLGVAQGAPQSGGDFSTNPDAKKLPTETILVKGAWSSASDRVTPLPEGGRVSRNVYNNAYFGLAYPLSPDWTEKYSGPPPSDSGYYVLAQIEPKGPALQPGMGHVLIAAQDLFFSLAPVHSASELIDYYQQHLGADYRVERAPTRVRIANRDFVRLDYRSAVAGLHWHVVATEIRCHVVQFVFTGSSSIERLVESMNTRIQPTDSAPVCLKDFAASDTYWNARIRFSRSRDSTRFPCGSSSTRKEGLGTFIS